MLEPLPKKIIEVLLKLPLRIRDRVEEITLDMAPSMNVIAKRCFPKATIVTNRFHVQQLASEAVQEIRILNYFDHLSINASAESFNAKIKAFRSQFRGVRNIAYCLFRLTKIYAYSPGFGHDPKK